MRVDAKAEGDLITLGGWLPVCDGDGMPRTELSPWYSVDLDKTNAPWAYCKGEPYRTVSALELIASTAGLVIFEKWMPTAAGGPCEAAVQVTGFTDSQVSAAVVDKGMTTSFPLCVVAMELSAQLESRKLRLKLHWSPREVNVEADNLTNKIFSGFTEEKRLEVDWTRMPWLVLDDAMRSGLNFYDEAKRMKEVKRIVGSSLQSGASKTRKKRKGTALRDTDPW